MNGILHEHLALKKISSDTYSISCHSDWNVGLSLQGGFIAAGIHLAIVTHLKTDLARLDQPDVLRLHFEFLRPCLIQDSTITITPLKLGAGTSTFQLTLRQGDNDKIKVLALATATNFDRPFGPSAAMKFRLDPPLKIMPDLKRAEADQPQPDWIGGFTTGEVMPCMGRLLTLIPREGYPVDGVMSTWSHWRHDVPMDAFYLTLMTDIFPSMADTLLRNEGLFDAHKNHKKGLDWDSKKPGKPITLVTTVREAMKAKTFNSSLTLDIEFKRRVPDGGLPWIFTRLTCQLMENGQVDLGINLCDEKMGLLAVASQTMLVLEVERKFGKKTGGSKM